MDQTGNGELLRMIARGEVDLDRISETIRSADLVIRQCRGEIEELRREGERLQADWQRERSAADELARRLAELHAEYRLAREVIQSEVENRRGDLGLPAGRDLEALDMAGLLRERESAQQALAKTQGGGFR